jgi:hypothetical protein
LIPLYGRLVLALIGDVGKPISIARSVVTGDREGSGDAVKAMALRQPIPVHNSTAKNIRTT